MTGAQTEGRSIEAAQDGIVAELGGIDDLMEKYEHLIRLGRELRVPGPDIRRDEHSVAGCQSRVWIRTELRDGRLHIAADSDATITRGIIALLLRVFDGRTPDEILATELRVFEATGLQAQLSPARANGLVAMVRRIRQEAAAATGG
ncbi:MAG: SufE family protein [Gemmatimonadota bacterium]|nr:SufE family protein [Gemmatimonadota bacterium]